MLPINKACKEQPGFVADGPADLRQPKGVGTMTIEENKAVIQRQFDLIQNGDLDALMNEVIAGHLTMLTAQQELAALLTEFGDLLQ